jgi:hypothetical protein
MLYIETIKEHSSYYNLSLVSITEPPTAMAGIRSGGRGGEKSYCTFVHELQEIWHVQCSGIPQEIKQASAGFSYSMAHKCTQG